MTTTAPHRFDGAWKDHGVCATIGPLDELWYPVSSSKSSVVRSICARCPVQYECLNTALDTPYTQDIGYWGGTSEAARQTLRRGEGKLPPRRPWDVAGTATPEQADAARRHAADGRSVAWISYALHLTGPAVRAAHNDKLTKVNPVTSPHRPLHPHPRKGNPQ